ncbi:MAG: hypothetical protein AAGF32_07815 [Pseudomonadota bacterium]
MADQFQAQYGARKELTGWRSVADYLFGRNTLIGIASLMLLAISGYATWSGMSDFIVGAQSGQSADLREVGGLAVTSEMLVVAIVVALTFLMWLALREAFRIKQTFTARAITFPLYIFLALWSVGFGYGFWWSLIAGQEATQKGLASLQEDARNAAGVVAARLDAVKVQLDSVVNWSEGQMRREETSGGSCGIASGAGRGPLYNARRSVRDSIASLRDGVVSSWLTPVSADVRQLQATASNLSAGSVADRQREFERLARDIRGRASNIAARSNALGKSTAIEMRALAEAVAVPPRTEGFSCYDPTLAQRLTQAAEQAAQPATIILPPATFNEGPAGVANAVKNLWSGIGAGITGALSYVLPFEEGGGDTIDSAGLTGRDLIALLATLGIDLGLFALTALNPPRMPVQRDAFQETKSHLQLPNEEVIKLLSGAINTAISRAKLAHKRAEMYRAQGEQLPEKFPPDFDWIRQHLIYHSGASFFVIPNLYACDSQDKEEEQRALALNQLAGVFDDLDLTRPLTVKEFESARSDETRDSRSRVTEEDDIRNHGLFSKSKRTLEIAGWSESAARDFEIFRLTDTRGLTPLLIVLNEAKGANVRNLPSEHPHAGDRAIAHDDADALSHEATPLIGHDEKA